MAGDTPERTHIGTRNKKVVQNRTVDHQPNRHYLLLHEAAERPGPSTMYILS